MKVAETCSNDASLLNQISLDFHFRSRILPFVAPDRMLVPTVPYDGTAIESKCPSYLT